MFLFSYFGIFKRLVDELQYIVVWLFYKCCLLVIVTLDFSNEVENAVVAASYNSYIRFTASIEWINRNCNSKNAIYSFHLQSSCIVLNDDYCYYYSLFSVLPCTLFSASGRAKATFMLLCSFFPLFIDFFPTKVWKTSEKSKLFKEASRRKKPTERSNKKRQPPFCRLRQKC